MLYSQVFKDFFITFKHCFYKFKGFSRRKSFSRSFQGPSSFLKSIPGPCEPCKSLQLILGVSTTYRLFTDYLLICRLHPQCMISKSNVKFTGFVNGIVHCCTKRRQTWLAGSHVQPRRILKDSYTKRTHKKIYKSSQRTVQRVPERKNIQDPVENKRFITSVEIVLCGSVKKRWIVLLNGKPKNIEVWTQQAF